jgi:hypothetical protein
MGKKKVAPISTTADDKTPSKVTVPKNNSENRAIKARNNFVDDDNEDIAYLNFKLIWLIFFAKK